MLSALCGSISGNVRRWILRRKGRRLRTITLCSYRDAGHHRLGFRVQRHAEPDQVLDDSVQSEEHHEEALKSESEGPGDGILFDVKITLGLGCWV